MTKQLNVGIPLPLDIVTQRIGILGQTGVGKTHLTTVLTEEMIETGVPVACLDPKGDMWGLRTSRNGKSAGYPVVICGGDHQDVPLEPTSGRVIADWIIADRVACVLDMSNMRKNDQRRFATDFAEELYHKNREPLHLVVDEADMFAPQRALPGFERMLGAFEDLVRRGRSRGIGVTLATQRPAVLHKDVLTQVSLLVALRLSGPQDRNALHEWIRFNADEGETKTVLSSIASLPIGTAWFWSPAVLQLLKKVKVRQRKTFDSSATPRVGARRATIKKMAAVDLKSLSERIADTIERAKAEDPKHLKKRISELEHALAEAQQEKPPEVLQPEIDVTALSQEVSAVVKRFVDNAPIQKRSANGPRLVREWSRKNRESRESSRSPRESRESYRTGVSGRGDSGLRRILIALAQRPQGLTKRQLAVRARLSFKSGTYSNYLSTCRKSGWIEGSGTLVITTAGLEHLGHYEPLPTGKALQNYWKNEIGPESGAARMLDILCEVYPESLSAFELAQRAEMKTSGTFSNYLSKLRTLELMAGSRGALRASDELFDWIAES